MNCFIIICFLYCITVIHTVPSKRFTQNYYAPVYKVSDDRIFSDESKALQDTYEPTFGNKFKTINKPVCKMYATEDGKQYTIYRYKFKRPTGSGQYSRVMKAKRSFIQNFYSPVYKTTKIPENNRYHYVEHKIRTESTSRKENLKINTPLCRVPFL